MSTRGMGKEPGPGEFGEPQACRLKAALIERETVPGQRVVVSTPLRNEGASSNASSQAPLGRFLALLPRLDRHLAGHVLREFGRGQ